MALLEVTSGPLKGTKFTIKADSDAVSLGRSQECDVVVSDTTVSRRHAILGKHNGGYFVRDLGSTHGTFVNGTRNKDELPLNHKDVLRLGKTELIFLVMDESPAGAGLRKGKPALPSPVKSSAPPSGASEEHPAPLPSPPGMPTYLDGGQTIAFHLATDPTQLSKSELSGHHLALLARAANAFQSVFDPDELLNILMDMLFEAFEPDRGAILLYGEDGALHPQVVRPQGENFSISQTVLRHAVQNRMALLISDLASDSRFSAAQSIMAQAIQSTICAPLVRSDKVIGVIYLDARTRQMNYQKEDLALLNVLAVNAAIEIENARLVREKVESERLAAIGVAVAGISHYIKNILTGIKGTSYLIDMGIEHDNLKIIKDTWPVFQRATGKIGGLVQDMLTFSKRREPEWQIADINVILKDIHENQHARAEEQGLELHMDIDAQIKPAEFDPARIHDMLLNLTGNAIDACEKMPGATITLRSRQDLEHQTLHVTVVDDGPGIPEEIQKKIYEPFFSTKGSRGTGLGLAIARKIAEEHGGRLALESEVGKGSSFTLTLPLKRPACHDHSA